MREVAFAGSFLLLFAVVAGRQISALLQEEKSASDSSLHDVSSTKVLRGLSKREMCNSKPCQSSARRLYQSINAAVDPCEDFHEFACGNFMKKHPVKNSTLKKDQVFMCDSAIDKEMVKSILRDRGTDEMHLSGARDYYTQCQKNRSLSDEQCVDETIEEFRWTLGVAYVRKDHRTDSIKLTAELLENLKKEFSRIAQRQRWMDDWSRQNSIDRANVRTATLGYEARILNDWNEPSDPAYKNMFPLGTRAFYRPNLNVMFVPVVFFNEPLFGQGLTALDYGGLGAVMGHEMTHSYDIHSIKHGKELWTNQTSTNFEKLRDCFEKQYNEQFSEYIVSRKSEFDALNGRPGQQSREENTADHGGLRVAYNAYTKLNPEKRRLSMLPKYSDRQLFFLAFANMFCSSESREYTEETILRDEGKQHKHSPNRFRINVPLKNMPEFAETWGCSLGSKMNPVDKCAVW